MKNLHRILMFSQISVVLLSCHSEEVKTETIDNKGLNSLYDKEYIQTASLNDKLAYKEFHLASLMEHIIEVNPDFENLNEFKSAKEENPSYYLEVLLSKSMAQSKSKTITNKDETTSLDAFKDLDGETWYPIITRLKNGQDNAENALYLFNSFDEEKGEEFVKAFKYVDGKLDLVSENFTEEMFEGSIKTSKEPMSVYQLELSLCPYGGDMMKVAADCGGSGPIGGGTSYSSTKIRTMKIKDKKESWLEKADVHYIYESYATLAPGVFYDKCPPVQLPSCDADGNLIRKYSNGDLNENKTVDYGINNSISNKPVLQYVIFEYDKWPAGVKYYQEKVNGATINLPFRSYQSAYDGKTVTFTNSYGLQNGNNFSVTNSAIEYNVN